MGNHKHKLPGTVDLQSTCRYVCRHSILNPVAHEISSVQPSKVGKFTEDSSSMDISVLHVYPLIFVCNVCIMYHPHNPQFHIHFIYLSSIYLFIIYCVCICASTQSGSSVHQVTASKSSFREVVCVCLLLLNEVKVKKVHHIRHTSDLLILQ